MARAEEPEMRVHAYLMRASNFCQNAITNFKENSTHLIDKLLSIATLQIREWGITFIIFNLLNKPEQKLHEI